MGEENCSSIFEMAQDECLHENEEFFKLTVLRSNIICSDFFSIDLKMQRCG